MNISYFPNQTALQSEPVWKAFLEGCRNHNVIPVENSLTADYAVIWSVLWHGRMRLNYDVHTHYRKQNKPVFIIEVGALNRGVTWKICLNNITSQGIYPTLDNKDPTRHIKLGINLLPVNTNRSDDILIATQHPFSLQWQGLPSIEQWVQETITKIRQYTDRKIVVRPHPRFNIRLPDKSVTFETPTKLPNTYDRYDINFNYHCVINHCSGPSIQAAIAGTPIICDKTSLAYPVSTAFDQIEPAILSERVDWFNNICYTEWTLEEITQGIPQSYLL